MQDLAGRLRALDPSAGESVQVIRYFDALTTGGAGVEAIVRAAAVLSGASATALVRGRLISVDADGIRTTPVGHDGTVADDDVTVWLERDDVIGQNDAMIMDRARTAILIALARTDPPTNAVERLVDPQTSPTDREALAHRLKLNGPTRLVAASQRPPGPDAAFTVFATKCGAVWVGIGDVIPSEGTVGTSIANTVEDIPRACGDARLALRLATERHRVVDAATLGVLIMTARTFDTSREPHPDVEALERLDQRALAMLDVLVESDSLRAAAAQLSLHHSSLQSRHESWSRQLGYNPVSPLGRARFMAARLLQRLL